MGQEALIIPCRRTHSLPLCKGFPCQGYRRRRIVSLLSHYRCFVFPLQCFLYHCLLFMRFYVDWRPVAEDRMGQGGPRPTPKKSSKFFLEENYENILSLICFFPDWPTLPFTFGWLNFSFSSHSLILLFVVIVCWLLVIEFKTAILFIELA